MSLVLGGGAIGALCTLAAAWIKARYGRTRVEPDPLRVEKQDKYVTRREFEQHVRDNRGDHDNIFARLAANDKLTSRLEGLLEGIREDLKAIKDKLFKTRS